MKKYLPALILLTVFIGLSFQFINEPLKARKSEYRSTELRQVVTKYGNVTRTDYVDEGGVLRIAANVGYASRLVIRNDNNTIETFLDDQGERISLYYGYYGILREYDLAGNNIRITYLDENNVPTIKSLKYATEERTFNESGQQVSCRYLDTEGNPVLAYNNCYGVRYKYDDQGRRVKVTYIDEMGEPMIMSSGYSSLVWEYYETDGPENGKVKKEFYFLPDGTPASLLLGQYGIYKEYDENGRTSLITYLGADGSPIITNKGYTSVVNTYYADDSIQSTLYYDINGNPFRLSEGQYGTKSDSGHIIYLNADGTEKFNIKNFIYNESGFVIIIAILLVAFSALTGRRLNWLLLILYLSMIAYFTLMYRDTGEPYIGMLRSYKKFFVSAEMRSYIVKNIWLFIPLGAVLYRLWPRKAILLVPVILSITIEIIQYFTTLGMCELDDVISNGLGGVIGYGMGCLSKLVIERFHGNRKTTFRIN